tara:strand:+ start:244 stop:702 length:459 start_codon:yes stop_codon:yes gene_type:complete
MIKAIIITFIVFYTNLCFCQERPLVILSENDKKFFQIDENDGPVTIKVLKINGSSLKTQGKIKNKESSQTEIVNANPEPKEKVYFEFQSLGTPKIESDIAKFETYTSTYDLEEIRDKKSLFWKNITYPYKVYFAKKHSDSYKIYESYLVMQE